MKPKQLLALAGIAVLFLTGVPPAFGAPPLKPASTKEIPLRISATRLEADQKNGIITFSGQVKSIYGDYTLYSDKLLVYLKNQPAPAKAAAPSQESPEGPSPLGDLGAGKIDRIVAQGQVRFVQGDRVATGTEAIYYKDKDEVVLTGNPQLWQAENTLKGSRIVFNIATNKVLVESSPQRRVEALLYSKGTASGKTGLPFGPNTRRGQKP